jgi:hypothetical protein
MGKNKTFGGSCILFIDEFRPFYRPKFHTLKHPIFSLTGSSFKSGIPNNADIKAMYAEKANEKVVIIKSKARKFAEMQVKQEQEQLHEEFNSGTDLTNFNVEDM